MSDKAVTLAFICCKPEKINPDLSPVILHHGCMSSKERWRPVQQDLANSTGRIVPTVLENSLHFVYLTQGPGKVLDFLLDPCKVLEK
ncbi:hypothetical protein AVEN_30106-2 [Araneus ventricosus]|uniref:Uncharacterized protein n=1 Tax=Araneus ventricosus TaxID=182803 RepID=A0A4Y2TG95_ARAVE|nr:hypothetical protein AVEN_111493-2 [Araneus ventricosus]GBO00783.1 hypothetical protein AVEN_29579-2 [Araneus ventricosus]GBO08155.1 hypothetical protein AVEN_30106-2 [Araneus ventricosus]